MEQSDTPASSNPQSPEMEDQQNVENNIRSPNIQKVSIRKFIPGVVLETNTRLNITVRKVHVCGEWKWRQGGEDTCGICRMEFESACNMCKFPGDDCPLVVGSCRHAFHRHCIDKWIAAPTNQPRAQCPLCRQDWQMD